MQANDFAYGTTPAYLGDIPTQKSSAQYDYVFKAWDKALAPVSGPATYTATYSSTIRSYSISFVGDGGAVLQNSTYQYGDTPVYTGNTPSKAASLASTYTFQGWDKDIVPVVGETTYTAQFSSTTNQYVVTFTNYDGSKILEQQTLPYGSLPVYGGSASTLRASTAQYDYTFSGWSPSLSAVVGDITYQASYTNRLRQYEVSFYNADGSLLEKQTLDYGDTPVYSGNTPAKQSTVQYSYNFAGWDKDLAVVQGPASYKATFTSRVNQYTIRFLDNDGSVLQSDTLDYGSAVTYTSATPYKSPDGSNAYAWQGLWDSDLTNVSGNKDYKPLFTAFPYTLSYTYDSSTTSYRVSGHSSSLRGIVIPSSYDDGTNGVHDVTGLADYVFANENALIEVSLPSTLTAFGNHPFNRDTALKKVNYSGCTASTLTGSNLFAGCSKLASFTLPEKITAIPDAFLADSNGLTSIVIPGLVTTISDYAFSSCSALASVSFTPSTLLTTFGKFTFQRTGLTSVTLPMTLTNVGEGTFKECNALTSASIQAGATTLLGDQCFEYCPQFHSFTIPSTVTRIDNGFFGHSSLRSITIPATVESIGDYGFDSCASLASVTFETGSALKSLGYHAFYGDTALTAIELPSTCTNVGDEVFKADTALANVTYSAGATTLNGENGFAGCTALTSFTIPAGVTNIGDCYFEYSSLTSITIPSSVISISGSAFANCTKLTSVSFASDSQLTTLGYEAFSGCTALTAITLPSSVVTVGDRVFKNDTVLSNVSYTAGITTLNGADIFEGCTALKSFTIPDTVTNIGDYYFEHSSLASITIPTSVATIGNASFASCSHLSAVTFASDSNLNALRDNAFAEDKALTAIELPAGLNDVGSNLFKNDTSLTSVSYAAGILTLYGSDSFEGCTALTSFTIPSTVIHIGNNYFENSSLTSVVIPTAVSWIDAYAFANCANLASVSFASTSNLSHLSDHAFASDPALTSLTLPASLSTIDDNILASSSGVTSLTFLGSKAQWLALSLNSDWAANSSVATLLTSDYSYDIATSTWTAR